MFSERVEPTLSNTFGLYIKVYSNYLMNISTFVDMQFSNVFMVLSFLQLSNCISNAYKVIELDFFSTYSSLC